MTIYEFRGLTNMEQANVVWAGCFLAVRLNDDYKILLYAVGNFYVEVFYSKNVNEIFILKPFKSIKLLDPYL